MSELRLCPQCGQNTVAMLLVERQPIGTTETLVCGLCRNPYEGRPTIVTVPAETMETMGTCDELDEPHNQCADCVNWVPLGPTPPGQPKRWYTGEIDPETKKPVLVVSRLTQGWCIPSNVHVAITRNYTMEFDPRVMEQCDEFSRRFYEAWQHKRRGEPEAERQKRVMEVIADYVTFK